MEEITDTDLLYYRVHKDFISSQGEILPAAFRDKNGSMSSDWAKYSTPIASLLRSKVKEDNAIISLETGKLRKIPQQVKHAPYGCNYSHTNIIGRKNTEIRTKIKNCIIKIEIKLNLEE